MRIPGISSSSDDWAAQAASTIERTIDGVRDKAVVPVQTVARALVYGTVAAIVGGIALVMGTIGSFRLLTVYLGNVPGIANGVWAADLLMGALFTIAGLAVWSRRHPRSNHHER